MGIPQELGRLYNRQIGSDAIRRITLPVALSPTLTADGAGSTYGAWADIALLATVLQDSLIVGVVLSNPSAIDEYTIDIGSCVGYVNAAAVNAIPAAIIAAHRQEVRVWGNIVTLAGVASGAMPIEIIQGHVPLSSPIFIPAGVGIIGRMYAITAVAVTIDVSVDMVQLY